MKAVLFDAAGVLTTPFSRDLVAAALEAGADAEVLLDVLFPMFTTSGADDSVGNRLERGEISLEEFFVSLGSNGFDVGLVLDPDRPSFFGNFMEPNLGMQELVRKASAAGFATALVSNNIREWQPLWDQLVPPDLPFDVRLYSWKVGMRKPEERIYRAALTALGVEAEEAIFVDDFDAMVEGAVAVGMHGVHFDGKPRALAEIHALLDL